MESSGYEPVRNYDDYDEKEERLHLNPNKMRTKKDAKENDDVHVEMANLQISESRRASIFANNNKNNERLVSLDIFRGLTVTVKCGVSGDTGPGCNAVGMIDRKILGIHHLYKKPIYARKHECSIDSPNYGPLPPDAPSWCQAPFDPEGFMRLMCVDIDARLEF
ncbi:hypothetical protein PIB30_058740 [Stylosanthes scabra]|uniref:Uncharacterized protein n=1 Tax=Stylosanthes scabra TaxID=79078 RepID=A0ABU6WI99_9FABA|nr:hypothetical protein [Stylosanthes scabra]